MRPDERTWTVDRLEVLPVPGDQLLTVRRPLPVTIVPLTLVEG